VFHVYGQPEPRPGDEVALPADGKFIFPEPDVAEAVAREI
jgi:hypothetical protein